MFLSKRKIKVLSKVMTIALLSTIIAGCGKVMISISIGSQKASQARRRTNIKSLWAIRKEQISMDKTINTTQKYVNLSDLPLMLTIEETAALLRVSKNTVYNLCKSGEIPFIKKGRRILIYRDDLLGRPPQAS